MKADDGTRPMASFAPYSPEDWPNTRLDAEGLDFDWFYLDQAGQLGVFCSATA